MGGTTISSYSVTQMDGVGNRTQVTVEKPLLPDLSASSRGYTYNSTNTLLQSTGNESFTYDNMGNMITRSGGPFNAGYGYSFGLTRLTSITGSLSDQFTYDGAGNRLKAIRNGVTTYYIYDAAGNLLAEADETKTIKRYYTWGNGLISLYTINDPIFQTKSFTYHFSPQGSTLALTDNTGTMKNTYAYTVFGELTQEEALPQPFKFVGQFGVMAEPDNLYYMRARYYDATLGRFLQQDPLGLDGGDINLYAYAGSNPVMGIDPWGLCSSDTNSSTWYYVLATREGLVGKKTATGMIIQETDIFVALPSRQGLNKTVQLYNPVNDLSLIAPVRDVGPWNTKDPYWATNSRPQAESGTDLYGRRTNGAGIDLSNEATRRLGFKNSAWVIWRFVP